jgi:hypothetical protein
MIKKVFSFGADFENSDNEFPVIVTHNTEYGGMYVNGGGVGIVVPIANYNQYYQVPYAAAPDGFTPFACGGSIAFQNGCELLIPKEAVYLICWSMSVYTALNGQDVSGCIMLGGSTMVDTQNKGYAALPALSNVSLSGNVIRRLIGDRVLGLGVCNHTAANDITVTYANFSITEI